MAMLAVAPGPLAETDECLPSQRLVAWREELAGLGAGVRAATGTVPDAVSDADRVDLLRRLEELKAAAAAAQARISVELDASQRSAQAAAGVTAERQGRGVAAQIGLARRDSPFRGARHLGLAKTLVAEMPHTLGLLSQGVLTEWRATLLARETACLSAEHRSEVDRLLCRDPGRLEGLGDQRIAAEAKKLAYRLDPVSVVRRIAKAEADRRVTIRPAPDTMATVTGLLPVAQGVAVFAHLTRAADALIAAGDPRSKGQIMADLFVERLTGQSSAADVAVRVNVVIDDDALLGDSSEPAHVPGYGPIPVWLGRRLAAEAGVELRRLYTRPGSGRLVAMDSRARTFPSGLRDLIDLRDLGTCRTPWCGAPIRHHDHVVPSESGGATSEVNGQGYCAACNYAKQAPGWDATADHGADGNGRHRVTTITPTGHSYRSTAPPLPGTREWPDPIDTGPPDRPVIHLHLGPELYWQAS